MGTDKLIELHNHIDIGTSTEMALGMTRNRAGVAVVISPSVLME